MGLQNTESSSDMHDAASPNPSLHNNAPSSALHNTTPPLDSSAGALQSSMGLAEQPVHPAAVATVTTAVGPTVETTAAEVQPDVYGDQGGQPDVYGDNSAQCSSSVVLSDAA